MNTQGAFDHFQNRSKKKDSEAQDGAEPIIATNSIKRMFSKMAPEGLIGRADSKSKDVVILSRKTIIESNHDIATQQKKVIMKDLLSVLKSDSRLAHKPLVYQLDNRVQ